ncbi:MAG: hypothetical protein JXR96_27605 [Deltaproteobacteria bacterium]|nr:hypothetical protein [Deltaproteobacteria bacterium]
MVSRVHLLSCALIAWACLPGCEEKREDPGAALEGHLAAAVAALGDHLEDCNKGIQGLERYVSEHRDELAAIAEAIRKHERGLSGDEREAYEKQARERGERTAGLLVTVLKFEQRCPQQVAAVAEALRALGR